MLGDRSKPGSLLRGERPPVSEPGAGIVKPRLQTPTRALPTRGAVGIPAGPSLASAERPAEAPVKRGATDGEKGLVVGKGIVVKGEISACEQLLIEGSVEANLKDSGIIIIAEGGRFDGEAHIDEADVSGTFEGKLTIRKRLIIRATGRVTGEIRYAQIEIERGGRLSGDVQANPVDDADDRISG